MDELNLMMDKWIYLCMDGKGRNVDMWMKTLVNLGIIIQNENVNDLEGWVGNID